MRKEPIDGVIQTVVATSFRTRVLKHAHYSFLAGHPVERRMYDLFTQEIFWSHTVSEAYTVVNNCIESLRKSTKFNYQRKLG